MQTITSLSKSSSKFKAGVQPVCASKGERNSPENSEEGNVNSGIEIKLLGRFLKWMKVNVHVMPSIQC